jgi:DNA-binding NtrC family response regulator/predicted hydrocarbon binding protein
LNREDLHVFGLVEFRPDEGAIFFQNRRIAMLSTSTFGRWHRHLARALGEEEARKITLRAGYIDGIHHYLSANQLFGRHEGSLVASRLTEVMGFSRVEVQSVCEAPSAFLVEISIYNSTEAEQHLHLAGPSNTPVCCYQMGFASGYCTAERRLEVYFKELDCVACGHANCSAIGRDAQNWHEELPKLRDDYGFNSFADVETLLTEQRQLASFMAKRQRNLSSDGRFNETSADPGIRKRTMKAIDEAHFIVREPEVIEIIDQAVCVARLNSPVLVQGETGTGKEFLVNLIHQQSARAQGDLISVNCAAFAESLLESELFGHAKGAFTGAVCEKPGLFELASDGTLFLDELGEMPLALQAKLLRAIEYGEIRRVGSNKTIRVTPRFLAATNCDLQALIAAGKFRQDLYFRLNSFVIQLPPLRERRDSIPPMAQHFLQETSSKFEKKVTSVSPEAMASLMAYSWPGNARELKHAIERAVVVTCGSVVQLRALPPEIRLCCQKEEEELVLKRGERQVIAQVLAEHQGNRTATAQALSISISTLWRKMKRYGLMCDH